MIHQETTDRVVREKEHPHDHSEAFSKSESRSSSAPPDGDIAETINTWGDIPAKR